MLSLVLALSCAVAPAPCEESTIEPGSGHFEYVDETREGQPLAVYYHAPKKLKRNAPVVFVLHGMSRTAQSYRDNWVTMANKYNALLICPQFSKESFPDREYAFGNVTDDQGQPRPRDEWNFAILERMFDEVKAMTGNKSKTYYLYGHSAGDQFVHRMVLGYPEARIERAVAANPGWYMLPDLEIDYPYGLNRSHVDEATLKRAMTVPLVILAGEQDKDPKDSSLNKSADAMKQGVHRLERAAHFYEAAQEAAKELGVRLKWEHQTVPGVGHNNKQLARPAAKALFD